MENKKLNIKKYDKKMTAHSNKLNSKVKRLSYDETITNSNNIDSVRTCRAATELKRGKLLKLQENRFFGEQHEFLEVLITLKFQLINI